LEITMKLLILAAIRCSLMFTAVTASLFGRGKPDKGLNSMNLSNQKMNHNLHDAALVRAIVVAVITLVLSLQPSNATQADDTRIALVSKGPGPTPFIRNLNFQVNPIANIKRVQFTIQPKAGSVTRPISATYSSQYLSSRGYLDTAGNMKIPVFGLYDGFNNSVTLNYVFRDGSSKQRVFSVLAPVFSDPCHYNERIEVLPRTDSTRLSYDFMLLKNVAIFLPP
jgi:Arylsulfotransferase Ig-like domain